MVTKLLVVAPVYYPDMGGGALASYLIVDLLAKVEGLKLTVLTGNKKPKRIRGVDYVYDPLLKIIDKQFFPLQLLSKRYEKIMRAHDVIYIAYAYPLIPVAKKLGKKTVIHLHDYRPISPSGVILEGSEKTGYFGLVKNSFTISLMQKRGIKNLIRYLLNVPYTLLLRKWVCMADFILTVSKRQAQIISRYIPSCKCKIQVLHNPIPRVSNFKKNLDTIPSFLYVGGDDYLKGFHTLIRSIKCIVKKHLKVKFFLIGSYTKRSFKIINMLNKTYGKKICVLGRVDHEKVFDLHKKCWGLLFPSITEEPLPYAVLESLAVETVSLSSKVGGVIEIMEMIGANDLLITPGDYEELCEAITRIMRSDRYYLEWYAHYLSVNFTKKYTGIFDQEFENLKALLHKLNN